MQPPICQDEVQDVKPCIMVSGAMAVQPWVTNAKTNKAVKIAAITLKVTIKGRHFSDNIILRLLLLNVNFCH